MNRAAGRAVFAFCWVLAAGCPSPCPAQDNAAANAPVAAAREICFPLSDGEALLRDVESGRAARGEANACREWQQEHLETDQARAEACEATGRRLASVTRERDDALRQAEANLQAGKDSVKVAGGSWWDRVKERVTWAGIGAAAAVVGKILLLGGL